MVKLTKMKVFLLGLPALNPDGLQAYLEEIGAENWMSDAKNAAGVLVEVAGRTCYDSFNTPRPGGNKAYMDRILEERHGSVLSHAKFNFAVTGVSRSLTHELVRHGIGTAFSQRSQRYTDESMAAMVCPDIIRNDGDLFPIWQAAVATSQEAYRKLAEMLVKKLTDAHPDGVTLDKTAVRKEARGATRSVLPNATETVIVFSANCRALRHIIEQRGSRHAEKEIRQLAFLCWAELRRQAPNIFGDYIISQEPPGFVDELITSKRKV